MKKIITLIISLVLSSQFSNAQIVWKNLGGTTPLNADNSVENIITDATGNVYAAGDFKNASGNYYVAKWNGTTWAEVASATDSLKANNVIYSLTIDANGNLYAAGYFTNASGNYYVAKWNGTTWKELASTSDSLKANNIINCIQTDALGNIYAAGGFKNSNNEYYVAKWNGLNWREVASVTDSLNANGVIRCMYIDGTNNVYVGGDFYNTILKKYVAKWDGTAWSEVGGLNSLSANSGIYSISKDYLGNVYAAGIFKNTSNKYYVAKFDGTTWSELGGLNSLSANNVISTITSDLNGYIYVSGYFKNLSQRNYVAKWNGSSWSEVGGNNALGSTMPNVTINISRITFDYLGNLYASGTRAYFGGTSVGKYLVAMYGACLKTYLNINKSVCGGSSVIINNKTYSKTGVYFDTLVNHNGCDSIITINLSVGIDTAKLCLVTVDSSSSHNVIVWEKSTAIKASIDSFRVYRETSTNVYSYLASIHRDSLSEYHDLAANPNTTSYKYKLTALDTCGHILPLGHYHNTIQLQNLGNGNFQWTTYQIENEANPVSYYIVLRDDNSTGNFQPISTTIPGSNSTYTDVNFSSFPNASYRVAVNWSIACSPSKSTSTSYSNILKFGNTGIQSSIDNSISIIPNPSNGNTTISLAKPINNATIKLLNATGQLVFEKQQQSGNKFIIDISLYRNGIYFIELNTENNTIRKKIIKFD